jgi:hypothetical protein
MQVAAANRTAGNPHQQFAWLQLRERKRLHLKWFSRCGKNRSNGIVRHTSFLRDGSPQNHEHAQRG